MPSQRWKRYRHLIVSLPECFEGRAYLVLPESNVYPLSSLSRLGPQLLSLQLGDYTLISLRCRSPQAIIGRGIHPRDNPIPLPGALRALQSLLVDGFEVGGVPTQSPARS